MSSTMLPAITPASSPAKSEVETAPRHFIVILSLRELLYFRIYGVGQTLGVCLDPTITLQLIYVRLQV